MEMKDSSKSTFKGIPTFLSITEKVLKIGKRSINKYVKDKK